MSKVGGGSGGRGEGSERRRGVDGRKDRAAEKRWRRGGREVGGLTDEEAAEEVADGRLSPHFVRRLQRRRTGEWTAAR